MDFNRWLRQQLFNEDYGGKYINLRSSRRKRAEFYKYTYFRSTRAPYEKRALKLWCSTYYGRKDFTRFRVRYIGYYIIYIYCTMLYVYRRIPNEIYLYCLQFSIPLWVTSVPVVSQTIPCNLLYIHLHNYLLCNCPFHIHEYIRVWRIFRAVAYTIVLLKYINKGPKLC